MTRLGRALMALASLLLLGELGVRLAGVVDVPLFVVDAKVGYLPAPSQQGSFMRRNGWAFNELSMGTPRPFKPGPQRDILLVGDSVVYGGPHYRDNERLGPLLEQAVPGSRVWPLAAGSWATRNELAWLRAHPEVVRQVDDIVFVTTSGDFTNEAATWHCESNNPTHRPWSALWYLAVKKWQLERCDQILPEHQVPSGNTREELAAWLAAPELKDKRLIFVLYPFKEPFEKIGVKANQAEFIFLKSLTDWIIIDLAAETGWRTSLYKDDAHPTAQGNAALAVFIAKSL